MCRIVPLVLISLFCFGPTANSVGQTRRIDSPEVLKPLLAMPAPTPHQAATPIPDEPAPTLRPADFYRKEKAPPDDAPSEDLVQYWNRWSDNDTHFPSDAVRQRLLDACLSDPAMLSTLLEFLPEADATHTKVKELYDKEQADPRFEPAWREKVRKWLVFNSAYFLDELIALANRARDNDKDGQVYKEDSVAALARVSWTNAEPLLRRLMASGQPRSTALALSLFYKHAVKEKDMAGEERYRRDLQAIAVDRTQPGYARDAAIEVLATSEWSGRDEWYLSLFQDETLIAPTDGAYSVSPLTTLVQSHPDKWVPIMTRLVEGKDLNVRSAAASCLVTLLHYELRKDALAPLLPWLENPAWANDSASDRLALIRSLGHIDMPESVPALISVVDNEDAEQAHARSYAAEALARYKDPRAAPALKRALSSERDESQRHRIIKGLLACHGLTETEQVQALEDLAAKLQTAEGRQEVWRARSEQEEPLPTSLSIARFLISQREVPDSLIGAVFARADHLRSENPGLANALVETAHTWQGRQVEFDMVSRIAAGSADSTIIMKALERGHEMREGLRSELQGLASVAGAAQGVGAVLLDDPVLAEGILTSEDEPAQIALLACARLMQMALPVESVGKFLRHKDSLLANAAEAYLLAEDSREARELLWQHHPNRAYVTGWRENIFFSSRNNFAALSKHEEQLRGELLKENGPTEIFAYLHNDKDRSMVLRVYPDKAIYTESEDAARFRERNVPKAEVSALKDYLTTTGFPDRGPTFMWCPHGCPATELLTITKEKGRRVFAQGGLAEWVELQNRFTQLAAGAKVHYKLEQQIKGLEVLYASELTVKDVAQQGGELRVFVERDETKEETEEREGTYDTDTEDDEDAELLEAQRSRRRVELKNARFSWRVFANDKVAAVTTQPDFYATLDETRFMTGDSSDLEWEEGMRGQTQVVTRDSIVIARNSNGLWRQFADAQPVRLGTEDASYLNPLVTADGKWVIVAKTDGPGAVNPGYVVRVNLQTGREFRINLPPADEFSPYATLPSLGKVLLRRAKGQVVTPTGPDRPEFYLLDPATGATRLVTGGDFTVLVQAGNRFLQAAGTPHEFWAAVPDEKKNQTEVGRYSVQDFSFKPIMVVPQILFNSMTMWVDADQAKVYVVYKGQLLRLPLQPAAK